MQVAKSIRWTTEKSASEFGIDRKTLTKRIRKAGIEPGDDGKFSTSQICAAIFGDKASEELRKTREEADKLALHNAEKRGQLVELSAVESAWQDIVVSIRTHIQLVPGKIQSRLRLDEEQTKQVERDVDEVLRDLGKAPDYRAKRDASNEQEVQD